MDYKELFREGWNSYWNNKNREDCPYVKYSSHYKDWSDGWYEAQHCDVSSQPRGIHTAFEEKFESRD